MQHWYIVQAITGVPDIKDGYNPATWALDITNTASSRRLGVDFADAYEASPLYRSMTPCTVCN